MNCTLQLSSCHKKKLYHGFKSLFRDFGQSEREPCMTIAAPPDRSAARLAHERRVRVIETVSSVINYDLMGLSCIYATLACIREAYRPRRRETLVYLIFVCKFTTDAILMPAALEHSVLVRALDIGRTLFFTLLATKEVADIYGLSLFEGFMWLTVANIPLSLVMGVSHQAGLLLFDRPPDTIYLTPLHASTFFSLAVFALQAVLLKGPIALAIKMIRRASKRFRVSYFMILFFVSAAFCISTYTLLKDFWVTDMRVLYWWLYPVVLVVSLPMGVLLILNVREARAQALLAERCLALTASWKERIERDFAAIERDKALFAGLDEKLLRLEGCVPTDFGERVRQLNERYELISRGVYCGDVAIDAILSAHAARLRELGATAYISVVAPPKNAPSQAPVLLALLDDVVTRAVLSRGAMGAELELRLRPLRDGLLIHLDLPASWGRLRLRRVLREAGVRSGVVARERVEGGRTMALILLEGVGAC